MKLSKNKVIKWYSQNGDDYQIKRDLVGVKEISLELCEKMVFHDEINEKLTKEFLFVLMFDNQPYDYWNELPE